MNMATKKNAIEAIRFRMQVLGIKLDDHVNTVLNSWENGFNFIPNDWKAFAWALRFSGSFCVDETIAQRFQERGSVSWRQVGDNSSLHVLLRKGKPYSTYKKIVKYYQIHIDSVSVVTGQDDVGKCNYAVDLLAKHNIVDKWKLPFIVPDRGGTKLGFRF